MKVKKFLFCNYSWSGDTPIILNTTVGIGKRLAFYNYFYHRFCLFTHAHLWHSEAKGKQHKNSSLMISLWISLFTTLTLSLSIHLSSSLYASVAIYQGGYSVTRYENSNVRIRTNCTLLYESTENFRMCN